MANLTIQQIGNGEELRSAWSHFLMDAYPWPVFGTHTFRCARRDMFGVLDAFKIWMYRSCGDMAVDLGDAERIDVTRQRLDRSTGEMIPFTSRDFKGQWRNSWKKRKTHVTPAWVVGIEPHASGSLHMHSLVWFPEYYCEVSRRDLWKHWHSTRDGGIGAGLGRFEKPHEQEDVAGYIAKYVTKGGEVVLSDSFGCSAGLATSR
jgi:hypothetical protein